MKFQFKSNSTTTLVITLVIGAVALYLILKGYSIITNAQQAQFGCNIQSFIGYKSHECSSLEVNGTIGGLMLTVGILILLGCAPRILVILKDMYSNFTEMKGYNDAVSNQPENPNSYIKRAEVYMDKREDELALADLTKALRLDPNNCEALGNRGSIYMSNSDWDRALADYNSIIKFDPKNRSARMSRAMIYTYNSDWDRALADYNSIIEHHKDDAYSYFRRGEIHEEMNNLKKALVDFEKASALSPNDIQYKNKLTKVKAKMDIDKSN